MGQGSPRRLTYHPTLSIRLRLLLITRRSLHSLSGVGLVLALLLSAPGALAQGFGGMGGMGGGGFGPSSPPPPTPKKPAKAKPKTAPEGQEEPELHAASGGGESTIQQGNEPTLPENPLAMSDAAKAAIGSDTVTDEQELGREPVTDRDFYGLYYRERSDQYKLQLTFPVWMERTQPSLSNPAEVDRASLFGGVYYNRRSADHNDDILFPVFWNLRDRESRTTIVGPLVNRVAPGESDNWLAPLYFVGERTDGDYQIIPPLLTYFNRDKEGGVKIAGPAFCTWSGGEGCFDNPKDRDLGIAPLFFSGRDEVSEYRVIPPLLHYHEIDQDLQSSLDIWGPYFRKSTKQREYFHLMPLYWSLWGEHERHTTLFPFFHYGWNKNATKFITPLFYSETSEEGNDTFATYLYARYRGRTELDMYTPLLWLYRDPDIELDQTLLFPFYYRRTSPRENSLAVFPFFGHFERYGISESTWVTPLFNHSHDTMGWSTSVNPLFYFGRTGYESHSVVAPFFWDFSSPMARTTIVAPVYWRFAKPDSLTQLVGNILYTETRTRQGLDWKFHVLPAFSYGETPDGHSWDVLFGLVGYKRKAAMTQLRFFWIPITLSGEEE